MDRISFSLYKYPSIFSLFPPKSDPNYRNFPNVIRVIFCSGEHHSRFFPLSVLSKFLGKVLPCMLSNCMKPRALFAHYSSILEHFLHRGTHHREDSIPLMKRRSYFIFNNHKQRWARVCLDVEFPIVDDVSTISLFWVIFSLQWTNGVNHEFPLLSSFISSLSLATPAVFSLSFSMTSGFFLVPIHNSFSGLRVSKTVENEQWMQLPHYFTEIVSSRILSLTPFLEWLHWFMITLSASLIHSEHPHPFFSPHLPFLLPLLLPSLSITHDISICVRNNHLWGWIRMKNETMNSFLPFSSSLFSILPLIGPIVLPIDSWKRSRTHLLLFFLIGSSLHFTRHFDPERIFIQFTRPPFLASFSNALLCIFLIPKSRMFSFN